MNLLAFLIVHTGRMRVVILEQNNAANYIPALEEFRRRHRWLRGAYLIHDGGPSHIAGATAEYLNGCHGWWRPRLTPARASWLDQAELLIHTFEDRYQTRSSWHDREEFIRHVAASWPEYNEPRDQVSCKLVGIRLCLAIGEKPSFRQSRPTTWRCSSQPVSRIGCTGGDTPCTTGSGFL